MPVTKVSNLIVPQIYSPYALEKTTELWELMQAGIIDRNAEFDSRAAGGGAAINLPFFKEFTGDSKLLDENTPATPQPIGTNQDTAALFNHFEAWGDNVLSQWLSGDDPLMQIATMEGGVPLFVRDGTAIGGVGVSGASSEFDTECGTRAAEAAGLLVSPPKPESD